MSRRSAAATASVGWLGIALCLIASCGSRSSVDNAVPDCGSSRDLICIPMVNPEFLTRDVVLDLSQVSAIAELCESGRSVILEFQSSSDWEIAGELTYKTEIKVSLSAIGEDSEVGVASAGFVLTSSSNAILLDDAEAAVLTLPPLTLACP